MLISAAGGAPARRSTRSLGGWFGVTPHAHRGERTDAKEQARNKIADVVEELN
jgi:hypothetical protein